MESYSENSLISSTEDSVTSPLEKRQKVDGGQCDAASHQVVIYKNDKSDRGQVEQGESHFSCKYPKLSKHASPKNIVAFAAQCAQCQKWRLVSTKEKYEEIRERVLEDPFVCEKACEWKPDVTCNDPSDISQDGSKLWAIDKPNIAQTPPGWERVIKIRGEGCTKFSDVYYKPPIGATLRSRPEVEKYLKEHPEYLAQGVKLSQFSFLAPAPLKKDYVAKRAQTKFFQPEEVQPIAWAAPPTHDDLGDNKQLVLYNEGHPEVVQSALPEPKKPESPLTARDAV